MGNEGLAFCETERQRQLCSERYKRNLRSLTAKIEAIGARPMLGGLYPNQSYSQEHHATLLQVERDIIAWGYPVFQWLPVLDDGKGHWKEGLWADFGHPNTEGHARMADVVDLDLFRAPASSSNL
mmetsp:Transcript_9459/g.34701  ORF Transcript_9459/g.34701 Transcript_9459/m.34701 type:complete len:125 (-) Transcript_9459:1843-2217(-)